MLEMIFKIYQPKSSFSLYSNLFDLTNTPIPVLISYFHAHKCSQSSMTKALALLLTPVDVNTDIDDTIRKMVGDVWDPGMNVPFDPIASKLAEQQKMHVAIVNGTNIKNLDRLLSGKTFAGTRIED